MLSATVIPTKVSSDFIFFSRIFTFVLVEDVQNLSVGVFV